MIRYRYHFVVTLGRFNDAVKWVNDLNAASVAAGLTAGKLWAPAFGTANSVVYEVEYADWTSFHKENDIFNGNADCMRILREGTSLNAAGQIPWDEALEEAPTLA